MGDLEFYRGELVRITEELRKESTFKKTQRYVNLMAVRTQLNNTIMQLEAIEKNKEETAKREAEERKAKEEAEKELKKANKKKEPKEVKE